MALSAVWLSTLLALGNRAAAAAPVPALSSYDQVIGQEVVHTVTAGETLGHIAHAFGIPIHLAAAINRLGDANRLHLGQRLVLSDRHIVPARLRDGLVVNVGDLMLYWLRDGAVVANVPVGVGRVAWATPAGHYTIVGRRHDPIWHVPRSIQREMQEQGEPVKKKVPAGPDNPLGKYWLQLSAGGYGIHGTNAPWTVGKYTTHGCIRLRPDDIERLYKEVPTGTAVDIINEPIKVARLDGDRILLEAHPGVTDRPPETAAPNIADRLREAGVIDLVDVDAAERVVRDAWGVAVDVSKRR
jgi:L,D-transpeptidase ErfK/SrfK